MRAYEDTDASGHEVGDWPTEEQRQQQGKVRR